MKPRYGLPRCHRLRKTREFDAVRAGGVRAVRGCLIVNWMRLPLGTACRLGVVVSRKVGGAVVRSRTRRLLREAFRRHQHDFKEPVAVVLVARPSIHGKNGRDVERDFLAAMSASQLLRGAG